MENCWCEIFDGKLLVEIRRLELCKVPIWFCRVSPSDGDASFQLVSQVELKMVSQLDQ